MPLAFDLLILAGILASALPGGILLYHRHRRPKSWEAQHPAISATLIGLCLLAAALLIYGSFIEPQRIIARDYTIDLPHIQDPITIAVIADGQVGPYKKTRFMQRVVNKIIKFKPDLVVMVGDHINNSGTETDEARYLSPIAELTKHIPTYAVHGNHEYGVNWFDRNGPPYYGFPDLSQHTKEALEAMGVRYLTNEVALVEVKNNQIILFGGDSWWAQRLDFTSLGQSLTTKKNTVPVVALIHNPAAAWRASEESIDLMIAGHTHGGQIRLPLWGPIGRVDNVIPKQWYQGYHTYQDMQLFVTSGIGETATRARLFNPPEISLLTII